MAEFKKYTHIEKYGTDEVKGIENGTCYIFPKLDGINGSVWYHDGWIRVASRNKELSSLTDKSGFHIYCNCDSYVKDFVIENPNLRLFGEFLTPRKLRTYMVDAFNQFYVFDVYDDEKEKYLSYLEYKDIVLSYGLNLIEPIEIIDNPSEASLIGCMNKNDFLIQDGKGTGEGIVIKNYDFINKFGNMKYAKIVKDGYKTLSHPKDIDKENIEQSVVEKYLTKEICDKAYLRIVDELIEKGIEFSEQRHKQRLLDTIYHDFVVEEIWTILRKAKNPVINFKKLKDEVYRVAENHNDR